MPASSFRGGAPSVDIKAAAAARVNNVPVVENNFAGIPAVKVDAGEPYTLHIEGEFEVNFVSTATVGAIVYINATSGALALTAAAGLREFGKVTRIQGDPGVPTGKMWVKISQYSHATTGA